jgi:hypothetical protein
MARTDGRGAPRTEESDEWDGFEESIRELLGEMADHGRPRSEATLQSDIRRLLLTGGFDLGESHIRVDLETHVGKGRRIDIEIGYTAIEVKRHLGTPRAISQAERQLAGYVQSRSQQTGERYVGVPTDGATWHAYNLRGDTLVRVASHSINPRRPDATSFFYWLVRQPGIVM